MNRRLGELDVETFLAEVWQRKPCLLRGLLSAPGATPDFPLDGNDLAGLACEPLAEARLITGPDAADDWILRHGPFDEDVFDDIGDRDWTLLVQDVEKHYPPAGELLRYFNFLPAWRVDDLMVSFAAPGGSVGPHVDQYDVFLCQIEGRRRWEIAAQFDPTRRNDVPIDMLARFDAEECWELEPGDVLYLPPNVAHHGVALDPCLTASVGFRAPSAADLALALGEWLARTEASAHGDGGRYRDGALSSTPRPGEIDLEARQRLAGLLRNATQPGAEWDAFIGTFLSRFRLAHEPVSPPGAEPPEQLRHRLSRGDPATLHPWGRFSWFESENGLATLFASGQAFACSPAVAEWVCAGARTPLPEALDETDLACLDGLLAGGHLLLE